MENTFEVQMFLQRVVVPSFLGLAGAWILSRCERRSPVVGDSPLRGVGVGSILGALLVGAGLIVSDLWQRGLIANPTTWRRWEAREPWMWMVWLIPGLMLALGLVKGLGATGSRFASWCLPWVIAGSAAVLWVSLPQGEGYKDKLGEALRWMALGTAAVAMNSASVNRIAKGPGGRWGPLTVLVQMACIVGLAVQSYASLGEFVLSGLGVMLGLCIVSLILPSDPTFDYGWPLAPAVLGLTVMAAASLGAWTFYVTTPPALWLLLVVLFLPTLVGGLDMLLHSQPWGWRLALAALLWGLALAAVLASALQNKPEW